MQMTDVYGELVDAHEIIALYGVGYTLNDPTTWFVYSRETQSSPWYRHCGPYSTFEEAKSWILKMRQ